MGYSISEVAMKFGFSRTAISRVYHEFWESGKTSNLRHHCCRKKNIQERDEQQLMRIIKHDRRASLLQIVSDFNAGPSTSVTKHAAWSNESRFQLNRVDGRVRVWRQTHEYMNFTCQPRTVQVGGGSVMVWGVCSWRDMGPLIRLDTTLTSDRYVSILSDHLHPFMFVVHSDGLGEFSRTIRTPARPKLLHIGASGELF
ncbi:transposable element Tcb2 transposase [Trichonephila clavipes]|nr:transposable element Tcb2 transposase [Trichonephila clavipes]